jgi:hypothetical protein
MIAGMPSRRPVTGNRNRHVGKFWFEKFNRYKAGAFMTAKYGGKSGVWGGE